MRIEQIELEGGRHGGDRPPLQLQGRLDVVVAAAERGDDLGRLAGLLLRTTRGEAAGNRRVTGRVIVATGDGRWELRALADGRTVARPWDDGEGPGRWREVRPVDGGAARGGLPELRLRATALADLDDALVGNDAELVEAMIALDEADARVAAATDALGDDPPDVSTVDLGAGVRVAAVGAALEVARARAATAELRAQSASLVVAHRNRELATKLRWREEVRALVEEQGATEADAPVSRPVAQPAVVERARREPVRAVVVDRLRSLPRWLGWVLLGVAAFLASVTVRAAGGGLSPLGQALVVLVVTAPTGVAVGWLLATRAHGPRPSGRDRLPDVVRELRDPLTGAPVVSEAAPEEVTVIGGRPPVPTEPLPHGPGDEELRQLRATISVESMRVDVTADEAAAAVAAREEATARWWEVCAAAGLPPEREVDEVVAMHAQAIELAIATRERQRARALLARAEAGRDGRSRWPLVVDAVEATVAEVAAATRVLGPLSRTRQVVLLTDATSVASAVAARVEGTTVVSLDGAASPDEPDVPQLVLDVRDRATTSADATA